MSELWVVECTSVDETGVTTEAVCVCPTQEVAKAVCNAYDEDEQYMFERAKSQGRIHTKDSHYAKKISLVESVGELERIKPQTSADGGQ